jgi:lysophospholipase L1-like esterase
MCSRHWSAVYLVVVACTDLAEGQLQGSAASTGDPSPVAGASGASGQSATGEARPASGGRIPTGGQSPLNPNAPLTEPEAETASEGDTAGSDGGMADGEPAPDAPPVAIPGGPVTLWIAGDSTVANGNTPCPRGWGRAIGSAFDERVSVVNSAAGGRSVHTWLYDVQQEFDDTNECALARDANGNPVLQARWQAMLDGMRTGDYLLIQFGINDGDPSCDRHVGIEAFKTAYGMMANAAKARGATPIFITPVSFIACNGTTPRETRGGFVPATLEAGETFDVPVIDLHALSVQLYGELGFCPLEGGDVSATTGGAVGAFFCDDHTHFDQPGAERMAALMAGELAALGVGLDEYLR